MAALAISAGWRVMSLTLAVCVLAFVPVIAWLMRDRPDSIGLRAYGDTQASPAPSIRPAGNPPAANPIAVSFRALADASRSRDFWLIAGSYFVCGASTNGLIGTHLIPACVDHGLTEVVGAGLLAGTGVFAFIGGTASGWLSDRFDPRFLLFWYYGLRGLSLMYLPFALDMSFYGLALFAVFYGLDWIAGVPPTVRLLNRALGAERIGIMVAWITVIHQVGGAAAAYLGGVFRIGFGTYLEAFVIAGLMCIGAALMVLFIGSGRDRREPQPAALLPAE
jgi:sugar phosphate permease